MFLQNPRRWRVFIHHPESHRQKKKLCKAGRLESFCQEVETFKHWNRGKTGELDVKIRSLPSWNLTCRYPKMAQNSHRFEAGGTCSKPSFLVIYVRFRRCKMENLNVEEKFHLFCLGFCSTKLGRPRLGGKRTRAVFIWFFKLGRPQLEKNWCPIYSGKKDACFNWMFSHQHTYHLLNVSLYHPGPSWRCFKFTDTTVPGNDDHSRGSSAVRV